MAVANHDSARDPSTTAATPFFLRGTPHTGKIIQRGRSTRSPPQAIPVGGAARASTSVGHAEQERGGSKSPVIGVVASESDALQPVIDLANVLRHGPLRVLPILGSGPTQTLDDLATLRGVDAAMVQADALSRIGAVDRNRLRYVSSFDRRELHVLAGRSVTDLRELEGRKVNIGSSGSGTELTARIVFENLGVKPEFTSYDPATALKKLRAGEIDSVVYLRARPAPLLSDFEPQERFHLVPVPITGKLVKSYHPVRLEARHYPNLIKEEKGVDTLAVSNVLAVLDCPRASARCERLSRFVNEFFSHEDDFRRQGQIPGWEEISPVLDVQGWRRFRPAVKELRRSKQAGTQRSRPTSLRAASGQTWQELQTGSGFEAVASELSAARIASQTRFSEVATSTQIPHSP